MDDPVLAANTIGAFVEQVNMANGVAVPENVPASTELGRLWSAPVTVEHQPLLYRATTAVYPFAPGLEGILWLEVSDAAAAQVRFSVAVAVNGYLVTLIAKNVAEISTDGLEFELPERVELGTIEDVQAFLRRYDVDTGSDANVPPNAAFAVEAFTLTIPGVEDSSPTRYTLRLSATSPGNGSQGDPNSIVFSITNPPPRTTGPVNPVPGPH